MGDWIWGMGYGGDKIWGRWDMGDGILGRGGWILGYRTLADVWQIGMAILRRVAGIFGDLRFLVLVNRPVMSLPTPMDEFRRPIAWAARWGKLSSTMYSNERTSQHEARAML